MPKAQHDEFLEIVVLETERITRLINQVLDIEKIQFNDPKQGKPTGSGLGLFITKQIVDHHKGTISVESKEGQGAVSIVKLPIS